MRALAIAVALLLAAPATAAAAPQLVRSSSGQTLTFVGTDDADRLVVASAGATVTYLSDVEWGGLPLGCTQDPASKDVACAGMGDVTRLVFRGEGGNDTVHTAAAALRVIFQGGDGDDSFIGGAGDDVAEGQDGADTLMGGPGDDQLFGSSGDDRLFGEAGRDTINGGAGGDTASGGLDADLIVLGDGRDSALGDEGGDEIHGGPGADALAGGPGDDTLEGGDDRDELTPGGGRDMVSGGNGFDLVSYAERGAGVTVSLDGQGNDGENGEGDNVGFDVEDISGGNGPDRLAGNGTGNVLRGNGGDDELTGGAGVDRYLGGDGDDRISARDGTLEFVDCGGGNDSAEGDDIDELAGCEARDLSADLVADADGDGVAVPADCHDGNPLVAPGAREIADDGVDQNCDGVDATDPDRDGDGSPRPADCNDRDATIRPGVTDQPGNGVDEDCDGVVRPFPRIRSTVSNSFLVFATFTTVKMLRVKRIPAGAKVRLTCRGRGCPRRLFNRTYRTGKRLLTLRPVLRRARLGHRARLEVRVTKRETTSKIVRFTIRRAQPVSSRTLCQAPDQRSPREC